MLEVIFNHDYDKSRFLRGAAIDEARIPDVDVAEAVHGAQPVRYLHPERTAIHLLDKPMSFDDCAGGGLSPPTTADSWKRSAPTGELVALMPDRDATKRELDQKSGHSTEFAVLVMRDEDKPAARKHFTTPLLFSIHEAKGIE